jgi:hypothetical protein
VMTRDIVPQETVLLVAWSISQSKTRWGIAITSMSPVIWGCEPVCVTRGTLLRGAH